MASTTAVPGLGEPFLERLRRYLAERNNGLDLEFVPPGSWAVLGRLPDDVARMRAVQSLNGVQWAWFPARDMRSKLEAVLGAAVKKVLGGQAEELGGAVRGGKRFGRGDGGGDAGPWAAGGERGRYSGGGGGGGGGRGWKRWKKQGGSKHVRSW